MIENKSKPLIIGIGNPMRGDDGVGIWLLKLLKSELGDKCDYISVQDDISRIIADWSGRRVIVLDAVNGIESGKLHILNGIKNIRLKKELLRQSHGLGFYQALELSKQLDKLPSKITLIGIEASNFKLGDSIDNTIIEREMYFMDIIKQFV